MKLKTIDDKGRVKYLDVGFWSFMKCEILVQLALAGIIYGIIILFILLFFIMFI